MNKFLNLCILVACLVAKIDCTFEIDCRKPPEHSNCCSHNVGDYLAEKCRENIVNISTPLGNCQYYECITSEMNVYNNKEFQKDEIQKLVENVKDDDLRKALNDASNFCLKETEKHKAKFIKIFGDAPMNITEDVCDVVPMVMSICFLIESEKKCPVPFRKTCRKCNYVYEFYGKCGDKLNFFDANNL